jgi:hypothetical protein
MKSKILWRCRTRQMTGSMNDRQTNVRSAYSNQGAPWANRFTEHNPLVWLYKTTLD